MPTRSPRQLQAIDFARPDGTQGHRADMDVCPFVRAAEARDRCASYAASDRAQLCHCST